MKNEIPDKDYWDNIFEQNRKETEELFMYKNLEAKAIAIEFMKAISPFCEQQKLVGSILRGCQYVGDIDLVVIPKFETEADETLFGEAIEVDILDRKLADMCFKDELEIIKNGDKIKSFKGFNDSQIQIDVYFADKSTWATTCLIRTGSREHNIKLCQRAIQLHKHLKADGSGLLSESGTLIKIADEREIFDHLELPYMPVEKRNLFREGYLKTK